LLLLGLAGRPIVRGDGLGNGRVQDQSLRAFWVRRGEEVFAWASVRWKAAGSSSPRTRG
jgi:hypothetical protein